MTMAPFLTAVWVNFHLEREKPPGDLAAGKQPLVLGVHPGIGALQPSPQPG